MKIKPLKWELGNFSSSAATIFCTTYKIYSVLHFFALRLWISDGLDRASDIGMGEFSTVEEAKTAAQADYEQRIMSALDIEYSEGQQHSSSLTDAELDAIAQAGWHLHCTISVMRDIANAAATRERDDICKLPPKTNLTAHELTVLYEKYEHELSFTKILQSFSNVIIESFLADLKEGKL